MRLPLRSVRVLVGWLFCLAAAWLVGCDSPTPAGGETTDVVIADTQPVDAGLCQQAGDCPASDDPCIRNVCVAGACVLTDDDGAGCDDGVACTKGDVCQSGKCVAGADTCECQENTHCAAKDDGNACNGTMFCNKVPGAHRCELLASSVVQCDTATDTVCKQTFCDPKSGQCATKPVNETAACDDGDPCTVSAACADGACKPGTASWCQCESNGDCAGLDSNACAGKHFCNKGVFPWSCKSQPGTIVKCKDGVDGCVAQACDTTTGQCATTPVESIHDPCDGATCPLPLMVAVATDKSLAPNLSTTCDDGDSCTSNSVCSAGVCAAETNVCLCKTNVDCKSHEDGDFCNGTLYCDVNHKTADGKTVGVCKLNPATVVKCHGQRQRVFQEPLPTVDRNVCQDRAAQWRRV